jgi:hypothetical protein
MKKVIVSIISFALIFCTLNTASAHTSHTKKPKHSKACRKGTNVCVKADTTGKTTSEGLLACINCCTNDTRRINSEPCFNFCIDQCSVKFSGMTVTGQ